MLKSGRLLCIFLSCIYAVLCNINNLLLCGCWSCCWCGWHSLWLAPLKTPASPQPWLGTSAQVELWLVHWVKCSRTASECVPPSVKWTFIILWITRTWHLALMTSALQLLRQLAWVNIMYVPFVHYVIHIIWVKIICFMIKDEDISFLLYKFTNK